MGDNKLRIQNKAVLTTGEVAAICRVSSKTVQKWVDNGLLVGYRILGSRCRRIHRSELMRFMEENNMPKILLNSTEL